MLGWLSLRSRSTSPSAAPRSSSLSASIGMRLMTTLRCRRASAQRSTVP